MRRILVDFNTREFVRPGVESIAVLNRLNPELGDTWSPVVGEVVLAFDSEGEEHPGTIAKGSMFDWVIEMSE